MKRYNDCFTGAAAIDWLIHNVDCVGLLKDGGQLTRQQAVKILELCFKFDVIEDVRGSDGTMISLVTESTFTVLSLKDPACLEMS